MAYIDIKNVNYSYPLCKEPNLKGISLQVDQGEFIGIIGKNGSGKTSLCQLIRGFIPHFFEGKLQGQVLIQGQDLADKEVYLNLAKKVGYVFQNPFSQMSGIESTVYDEMAFGLGNIGVKREKIDSIIWTTLKQLGLEDLVDKSPFQLSGGQQQRLAFASVLAMNPDIYIIDEPTSQLDPRSSEEVFKILSHLKDQGKTIFLVEHDTNLLADYADRILLMDQGQIVRDKKPQDLFIEDLQDTQIPHNYKLGKKLKDWLNLDYLPSGEEEIKRIISQHLEVQDE